MTELQLTRSNTSLCLALGFFDSVHFGHRMIIERVVAQARERSVASAVMTFANNPLSFFGNNDQLVYTYEERKSIFEGLGVDCVLPLMFDSAMCRMSASRFLRKLVDSFDIKMFASGYDFTFGKKGQGDVHFLTDFSAKINIEFFVQEPVLVSGVRVSSTLIRTLLLSGNISGANELLGEPWWLCGRVVKGDGIGHSLDTPTANIFSPHEKLVIGDGVYGTFVELDGRKYRAVTSVGSRPTFGSDIRRIETHLLGFEGELYGKTLKVSFVKKLREIEDFGSVDQLKMQLARDKRWE